MEKRDRERAEVQRAALWALEHAQELEPHSPVERLSVELRLWRYPSFLAWRSWTVLRAGRPPADARQQWVREVSWDMPADMRRLSEPMEGLRRGFHTRPALSLRDAELPAGVYQSLASPGRGLRIPVLTRDHPIGLDGDAFGLETGDPFAHFRCEWWNDGPQEWREFVRWAAILREFLQRSVEPEGR